MPAWELAADNNAEQVIHSLLEDRGYRLTENREFFNVSVYDAIKIIQEYKEGKLSTNFIVEAKEKTLNPLAFFYFEQAKDYYYGLEEETLQDYHEAYYLFKKSSDLGSLKALEFMGKMMAEGDGCQKNIPKALKLLKKGAQLGNRFCYAEMAIIYNQLKETENIEKCYTSYFNKLDIDLITIEDIYHFTSYVENQFEAMNKDYFDIFALFRSEMVDKFKNFTQLAVDTYEDEGFVNFLRDMRGERIKWLESLKAPDREPTIYDVFGVSKIDTGVVIFANVVKGIPYSLSRGDRIIIQSPSKKLEVEIQFVHNKQTSPAILISNNPEDYDKYLFIKEGAALKPIS